MTTLSHIRRPLRRARGSQWYRDKGDRSTGTWCGAPDTRHDIQESVAATGLEAALEWINRGYGPHEICPQCIAIRSGRKP